MWNLLTRVELPSMYAMKEFQSIYAHMYMCVYIIICLGMGSSLTQTKKLYMQLSTQNISSYSNLATYKATHTYIVDNRAFVNNKTHTAVYTCMCMCIVLSLFVVITL